MATQINIPDNLVSYAEWAVDIAATLVVMLLVSNWLGVTIFQAFGLGWLNALLGWPTVIIAGVATFKAMRKLKVFI